MTIKSHTSVSKTTDDSSQHSSAGENAVAIAPPDYGIEFVDRGLNANAGLVLQGKFAPAQRMAPQSDPAPRKDNIGLPDNLKSGIESLSGMSVDNVKVLYNSSRPAQLNALAYTQGSEIHVAPGQEQHLPHEAWHVVQQAQGRVQPTMQMKDGIAVNNDQGLEREADVMGAKVLMSGGSAAERDVIQRVGRKQPSR